MGYASGTVCYITHLLHKLKVTIVVSKDAKPGRHLFLHVRSQRTACLVIWLSSLREQSSGRVSCTPGVRLPVASRDSLCSILGHLADTSNPVICLVVSMRWTYLYLRYILWRVSNFSRELSTMHARIQQHKSWSIGWYHAQQGILVTLLQRTTDLSNVMTLKR